jgi:serine phosphatase RsbU (regulator of sigma subunit)
MERITDRINRALAREERRAERIANTVRLIVLMALALVECLNLRSLTVEANVMNASVLLIGYMYGFIVFLRTRRPGHHPLIKYVTSCLDIILVFLLLFLYTRIEIPAVALKNYVFYVVFPLIALTAFRYDRKLTLIAGSLAVVLYLGMLLHLYASHVIVLTHGGYEKELFSADVTYVGQATKILILIGFTILMASLAQYSRDLLVKLVQEESALRYQKEQTEWELKIASQVQSKLLPQIFPQVPGLEVFAIVQQGKYVGGDYCDFVRIDDDVVLMVTADASGKGVPAALIMAEVRASTQLLASMNMDLAELVQRLNVLVHQSTSSKNFVTFFIAAIDVPHRHIKYVNAGHPPPLIYSGHDFRSLSLRTIPLGIQSSLPQLSVGEERFAPGSIVVSYTDGLSEQTDQRGEEYGEERLRTFIQTHADLAVEPFSLNLLAELQDFGGRKELHDDIGLAVAKIH